MLHDTRFDALVTYAGGLRHHSEADARGRCLHATLVLGREAVRLGLGERVAFVRWQVRDDLDFLEHWALSLGDGRVLDTTSIQVDGRSRLLRSVGDYPSNYDPPRGYPVALVLDALPRQDPLGGQYARRDLWSLHRALFRHDARVALVARSPSGLAQASTRLGRLAVTLAAGLMLERAIARLGRLLQARAG